MQRGKKQRVPKPCREPVAGGNRWEWAWSTFGAAGEQPEGAPVTAQTSGRGVDGPPAIWVATRILPSHAERVGWQGPFFVPGTLPNKSAKPSSVR